MKHENHQPVGAFKVRGGINLIAQLGAEERARGVMGASTGNHGQSIAYAAQLFDVAAEIFVPEGSNPVKVQAMRDMGAEVIEHGRDFDDAREKCQAAAEESGRRYIHSGNEPFLIEGVATYMLEILDEVEPDVVFVPIGGGSGAAGVCIAVAGKGARTRVIGVQSSAAPAAYRSWKEGTLVEDEMKTEAEGLATRTAFELPQQIMREHLSDFVLVDENEIKDAAWNALELTRNLVEFAGAAALAAAYKMRDELRGQTVAVIFSGGNLSPDQLRALARR